jgi:hypothetical protein
MDLEGRLKTGQIVKQAAQSPDVHLKVEGLLLDLLRSDVEGCAHFRERQRMVRVVGY